MTQVTENKDHITEVIGGGADLDENPVDILGAVAKLAPHKSFILKVTLGAAVLTSLLSLLLSNRYTATAIIMPPKQKESIASLLLNQLDISGGLAGAGANVLGLKNPNDIYVGMLQSRTVADSLISQFKLGEPCRKEKPTEIRECLASATSIKAGDDGLISIAVEDKDPKRAAGLANAYVDELRKMMRTLGVTEAAERRVFYEQQLEHAKDALGDAEVAMKNTQEKTGVIDLGKQSQAMIEAIGQLSGDIAAKEVELQSLKLYATPANPSYRQATRELQAMRAQLDKLERQSRGGNGDPFVATSKVPAVAVEYIRAERNVKYREAIFELVAQQLAIARLDEASEGGIVQVVDSAVVPDKKSWPARSQIVILVTMLAFFSACAYLLARDAWERGKRDPVRGPQLATVEYHLFRKNLLFRRMPAEK